MDSDRAVGTAKQVGGKVEGSAGDLLGDAKLQAQGRVDELSGAAQTAYGQAKDAVRDYAGQAGEVVRGYADQASDAAGRFVEQGRRYVDEGLDRYPEAGRYYRDGRQAVSRQVEESPLAAVLIAGAVGYILALLVHGRR